MSSEKEHTSPENSARQKKGKALLHVPSRLSSQRQQPSPTASSGISGATATDSRQSLGDLSKESTPSMQSRDRNGSASSHRSGAGTEPTTTPMPSQPASPATPPHKKKKSGGFFSLLGCCGGPREAAADGSEENVHKLDRLPNQRPGTARSKAHTPSEQQTASNAKTQLDEKETVSQAKDGSSKGKRLSNTSNHAQPAVGGERVDGDSKQSTAPAPSVQVQPPSTGPAPETQTGQPASAEKGEDGDVDTKMGEAGGSANQPEPVEQRQQQEDQQQHQHGASRDEASEQEASQVLPPPPGPAPSGNAPAAPTPDAAMIVPEAPQKSLLPPIRAEHVGRKCLVLDLDETLVHSSFKVRRPPSPAFWDRHANPYVPASPPSRLYHSGRD